MGTPFPPPRPSRGRAAVLAAAELLGVNAGVKLVEPKSLQRSEGKAQRVIDKRKI